MLILYKRVYELYLLFIEIKLEKRTVHFYVDY